MAQSMRPISDVTAELTGSASNLDGVEPDSGDYAYGANNSDDVHEVLMTDLSGSVPDVGTCTVNIYQAQADDDAGTPAPTSGGSNATFDIEVYEGATQRAVSAGNSCNQGSFAQFNSLTFSASAISDWSDVRLRFTSHGTGGSPSGRRAAAWCYAEIITPDEGSNPTNINAGVDSLTLTELPADVDLDVDVAAGVDSFTLTELTAAAVKLSKSIQAAVDAFTLSELGAAISLDVPISAGLDSFTLTELLAAVSIGKNIAATVDLLTLSEFAADVGLSIDVSAAVDALSLTEFVAAISTGKTIQAAADALGLTVFSANVDLDVDISAGVDSFSLTSLVATVNLASGTEIQAGVDSLAVTELSATVYTGSGSEIAPWARPMRIGISIGIGAGFGGKL